MNSYSIRIGLGGAALALLLGCQGPPPAATAKKPAMAAPGAAWSGSAGEQRIALLPPNGNRAVDGALVAIQERVRHSPEKVDGWIALGHGWVRKARDNAEPGYYRNAEACAAVALSLAPSSLPAKGLRALVLLNDHQFAEAQRVAEAILKESDFDPMALGTLSDARLELGQIDAAEEAAQQMLTLKPSLASYSRASYLFFLRGKSRAAKEAIRLAIDAAPMRRGDPEPRAWALTQAAQLFWHEGDYAGAEADYELALQSFADYPPALVGRGQVALAQERYRDAVTYLEQAYRSSPLAETAWLLGDARTLAGDARGAAAAYQELRSRGRRIDPRTVALYLATQNRDLPEALELIERERRGRNDLYTQDIYAYVLFRSGRLAEARSAIDAVLQVGLRDARIFFHAAAIHADTGDKKGAFELATSALQQNPHFDVAGGLAARALLGCSALRSADSSARVR